MNMQDTVADMLTRIRNAQQINKKDVELVHSKLNLKIGEILVQEGYLRKIEEYEIRKNVKAIKAELKYYEDQPVISVIKRVSKSSRRFYVGAEEIKEVSNGLGISIISTSKGVMTNKNAKKLGVGGEVLCEIL